MFDATLLRGHQIPQASQCNLAQAKGIRGHARSRANPGKIRRVRGKRGKPGRNGSRFEARGNLALQILARKQQRKLRGRVGIERGNPASSRRGAYHGKQP